jgi:hypothetical protein
LKALLKAEGYDKTPSGRTFHKVELRDRQDVLHTGAPGGESRESKRPFRESGVFHLLPSRRMHRRENATYTRQVMTTTTLEVFRSGILENARSVRGR